MKTETIYLTYDQALDLVERIADRAERFNHSMSEPEKEAMASLLSDIGVKTDDLIDVSNLADNYSVNADIRSEKECSKQEQEESLFQWKHEDLKYFCISW